jgi:mannose-1-phosphate guanylyltransferase/phosphomannomutase
MKAVIMAGGFGTRLRPLTLNLPKPMVPLGGVPVMEHLVKLLKKHNIIDITALLYFQADQIQNYFGDGSKW